MNIYPFAYTPTLDPSDVALLHICARVVRRCTGKAGNRSERGQARIVVERVADGALGLPAGEQVARQTAQEVEAPLFRMDVIVASKDYVFWRNTSRYGKVTRSLLTHQLTEHDLHVLS